MEDIFNIKYNQKLDRLEIPKHRGIIKIYDFVTKHKVFSIVVGSFIILSSLNFYMIFSFLKILQNF